LLAKSAYCTSGGFLMAGFTLADDGYLFLDKGELFWGSDWEIRIPHGVEALALALKSTHGRCASYWNASHALSGHAWQGRFYSCPLDEGHWWQALRYTELNPVRAGLAAEAAAWRWSSAAAHCGLAEPDACLDMEPWRHRWSEETWQRFLEAGEAESELRALRRCTHTGRPLGGAEFIRKLEQETGRSLTPRKGGRPPKGIVDKQEAFGFAK